MVLTHSLDHNKENLLRKRDGAPSLTLWLDPRSVSLSDQWDMK